MKPRETIITIMMMIERLVMKKIFTFKSKEYGYKVIHSQVYTYNISNSIDETLAKSLISAEFYDISEEDRKSLFDEKMWLAHGNDIDTMS